MYDEVLESMKAVVIKAVRENKVIGRGSCSVVDECKTDDEVFLDFLHFVNESSITQLARAHVRDLVRDQRDFDDYAHDIRNA